MEDMTTVGTCPRCGHPVHWKWSGNSAHTSRPCDCCGYRGFIVLRRIRAATAREHVKWMHERAMRDWRREHPRGRDGSR